MDDDDEIMYSEKILQQYSYRLLQKMAKSMRLPSNVKKVCLIKLIRAKKYCSESELNDMVQKVKAERKQFSKKRQVSSTENSEKTDAQNKSKNLKECFQLNHFEKIDECKQKPQNQTNSTSNKTLSTKISTNGSDRILRSSHLKKLNNSDHYGDDFGSTNVQNTLSKKDMHNVVEQRQQPVMKYMMPNRLIKRPEPNMSVSNDFLVHRPDRKPRYGTVGIREQISPPIRPRTLKWIYPLWPDVQPNNNSIYVKGLNVRQSNGKISKIQALIHKRDNSNVQCFGNSDVDVNIDPVMEIFLPNNDHNYINDSPFHVNEQNNYADGNGEEDKNYEFFDTDSLYYNDIDGELACCKELTTSEFEDTCALPNTDEMFKEIKNRDVTQPLYVETSDEWRKSNDFTFNNSDMDHLDKLFLSNINYDINEPLLKLATETTSYSSYNTSELSPIMLDQTSDLDIDQYVAHINTDLLDDINDGEQTDDTISEMFKFSQIVRAYTTQCEDHCTSMSSSETSQELVAKMNVQDMVEDAIDIIREDGDYLEVIGNVDRVQCIFCSWAGPQNLLENHVKNEHSNKINQSHNNECTIRFNLGNLVQSQLWLSEVIEHSSILYALCVKYEDPDYLMATIAPAPRERIPKDGPGPRGAPDCYYTSRVLNSTFRYVKFVRKLRAEEEEQRKGAEIKAKEAKDHTINDFFLRCDRKSLINDVARRVDLCLISYQEDLKAKRERLKVIFAREEEENIRKFVEQVQAGAEAVWQDKKDRLQYLLAKRRKEHAEKYKDTPLSKCVHVLPCIVKLRAMEAQQIQLYQMKEKEARKMAEKEFDKMWYEVAMKEADALSARMEYDAIERLRRDMECKQSTDHQVEQRRLQREREKELLKEQTLRFRAIWDEANRKEEAAQLARKEKTMEVAEDSKRFLEDKRERMAKESADLKLVSDAWDSLAGQGLANDLAMIELRKRKERELDQCNKKIIQLKKQFEDMDLDDSLVQEDARRAQEKTDQIRCRYQKWAQDTNKEVRKAMIEQIKDRAEAREVLKKKMADEDEYNRQLRVQLDQLVENKKMADAKARREHQKNLLYQIEYNNVLKERARQEELDQLKKYQIAMEEYDEEIKKMLCRPFFSDEIHPFMKQMAKGVKMAAKCPCSKNDYCK